MFCALILKRSALQEGLIIPQTFTNAAKSDEHCYLEWNTLTFGTHYKLSSRAEIIYLMIMQMA